MNWVTPMLQTFLENNDTLLDLGCGIGQAVDSLKCKQITGIDIWDYSKLYPHKFILKALKDLNEIPSNSYDIVFALDIIEHLSKTDGWKLIEDCERIARKKVFFLTPKDWDENRDAVEKPKFWSYGNKYNYHKTLWSINEFESKNYKIIENNSYIFALKLIQKNGGT